MQLLPISHTCKSQVISVIQTKLTDLSASIASYSESLGGERRAVIGARSQTIPTTFTAYKPKPICRSDNDRNDVFVQKCLDELSKTQYGAAKSVEFVCLA